MNDKKLLKSLLGLVTLSFAGKFMALISRLVMAKAIEIEAMSYFSLVNPLMVLLLNLAQFGLPLACSTLIAKHPEKTRRYFVNALFLSLGISLILMSMIYLCAPFIATNLLNAKGATLATYGLGLLVPLVALSSMLKAIYIGKGDVVATTYSTISEETFRLFFLLFGISFFTRYGPEYGAFGAVLGMAIGEVGQSVYLYFRAPKRVQKGCFNWLVCPKNDDMESARGLLAISLPITMARLVGSLTYCLEPIIYTNMLKGLVSPEIIATNYGVMTGYVMPLLLMPGFFSNALSNYLLPRMSQDIEKKDYRSARQIFKKLTIFCLTLGTLFSLVLFFGADIIMKLLYNTNRGTKYVRLLAFPFLIYYIETPIITAMHALNKTKKAFKSTVISSIVRLVLLISTCRVLGIYAVALSTIGGALIDISLNLVDVIAFFKGNEKKTTLEVKT